VLFDNIYTHVNDNLEAQAFLTGTLTDPDVPNFAGECSCYFSFFRGPGRKPGDSLNAWKHYFVCAISS